MRETNPNPALAELSADKSASRYERCRPESNLKTRVESLESDYCNSDGLPLPFKGWNLRTRSVLYARELRNFVVVL